MIKENNYDNNNFNRRHDVCHCQAHVEKALKEVAGDNRSYRKP